MFLDPKPDKPEIRNKKLEIRKKSLSNGYRFHYIVTKKKFSIFFYAVCCSLFLAHSFPGNATAQNRAHLNRIYKAATDFERLGRYDRAVEHFYTLFQARPESASYYNGLKRNLLRLSRYEELVNIVRQRLRVVDDIVGRADLGDALYKNRQEPEARKVWEELLERYKTSSGAYSQVAAAMLRNNLSDEAVAIYQKGRAVINIPSLFAIELANAYAARLQYDLATREFLQYLHRNPKQLPYTQQRILSLFNEDSGPLILQEVENYLQASAAPSFELLQIKANCLKKLHRFQEALFVHARMEALKPANQKNKPNGRELFNFAHEMQRIDHVEVAIAAYRELIASLPKSPYLPAAQIGLAGALVQSGKYDQAINSLDAMIMKRMNPNYVLRAYLLKGEIYLTHLNRPEQALYVYEMVQKSFRRSDAQKESAIALGDVYFRLGNMQKAGEWYNHAFRLFSAKEIGNRNKVHLKLAELAFCNRQFMAAIAILEKVQQVANAKPRENDLYNDALEFIFLIEQNLADSTTALALYADSKCIQQNYDFAHAADSLEALVLRFPQSLLAPKSLLDLGTIYGVLKQPEKKIEAYARATNDYAASIYADEATFLLAQAYEDAGQIKDAIGIYEKLLQDFPMSIYLEETRQRIRALRDGAMMQ